MYIFFSPFSFVSAFTVTIYAECNVCKVWLLQIQQQTPTSNDKIICLRRTDEIFGVLFPPNRTARKPGPMAMVWCCSHIRNSPSCSPMYHKCRTTSSISTSRKQILSSKSHRTAVNLRHNKIVSFDYRSTVVLL